MNAPLTFPVIPAAVERQEDPYAADRRIPVSFDINSLDTYKTARETPYRLSTDAWRC